MIKQVVVLAVLAAAAAATTSLVDDAVHVEMHVFANGANPMWTLRGDEARKVRTLLAEAPRDRFCDYYGDYSGFFVTIDGFQYQVCGDKVVEDFLMISALPGATQVPVLEEILDYYIALGIEQERPAANHPYDIGPDDVEPYRPDRFNNRAHQYHNNCYNYANDIITDTFAQPGRGTGEKWHRNTCEDVTAAALRDGLVKVDCEVAGCHGPDPEVGHYIAMAIWPNYNFHWARLDAGSDGHGDTGTWSHKPGQTAVRDYDFSGHKIVDPAKMDWGRYTDYCGTFIGVPSKMKID